MSLAARRDTRIPDGSTESYTREWTASQVAELESEREVSRRMYGVIYTTDHALLPRSEVLPYPTSKPDGANGRPVG